VAKAKNQLEHTLWQSLCEYELQDKKILVALSGGVDSVALLLALVRVLSPSQVQAAYVHHGDFDNKTYRDKAQLFCVELCQRLGVKLHLLRVGSFVKSEADMREHRYHLLRDCLAAENIFCLALGHHHDDLLETRVLRLIRGTGPQGLPAMSIFRENLFRPFLSMSKDELKVYLRGYEQDYLRDPSNQSEDFLRNWIRRDWLPRLEAKQKGAVKSLGRSLTLISEALMQQGPAGRDLLAQNEAYIAEGISRSFYLTLTQSEQRRLLAQYLLFLGKIDFSQSQLEEVQKRLDKEQKELMFKVAGCNWIVNAGQIKVES